MAVYQITITQTAGNTVVTEGSATDTYTLVLDSAPTADVIITLGNTNGQVSTDVTTLTFTAVDWNIAQTVTVTAVNDTMGEGMHRGVIQHTVTSTDGNYNGLVVGNVIVAVTDNDLPVRDPLFGTPTSNPLGLTDVGNSAKPTFVDIDGDGDLDAFIGERFGDTLFYENTGTANSAVFATPITNAFGLIDVGNSAVPTFVDINGDGLLDAFIGNNSGNTLFYQNTGTASLAVFAAPVSNAFGLTPISTRSAPSLVDIDGDGDLDAFIGNFAGNTLFYENTGTASLAVFAAPINNAFGLTNVVNIARPSFVDINGDGLLDAFIGNSAGNTLFYKNTGTASLAVFAAPVTNAFGLTDIGSSATPSLVDINGDGKLDALIGSSAGNTLLFINNAAPTLTAFAAALATGNEDTAITITLAEFAAQGDEADSDGTVTAFAVKAVSSGSLKIGVDVATATDWDVSTNYLVNATQIAYWTPAANANSTLNAFTVTAVDDLGAESATAIQATVEVTAVPDIIITQTAGNTAVTEGSATDTYTLVLDSAPTADVIITLGNTNGQINVDFVTLTFTAGNWNTPQTVTVSAVNDMVGEGMHRGVIQHTVTSADGNYNGLVVGNVIVAITDNDLRIGNAVFNSPTSDPLGLTDVGVYAKPNLVDIDGDGDMDAFIGSYDGNTLFYENTGIASLAVFATPISNAFGLTNAGYGAAPSLVDIDDDGDLDAFIGNRDGNALFYENNGTASLAAFAAPISDAFDLTDVGSFASPTFIDIDGDGDLDAFIGNFDGNTLFYQNNGTASLAAFTAPVSNAFSLTDAGISASPTFIDIDGDGDLDAFIGNQSGDTLFYQNIGTASLAVFAAPVTNALGLTTVGSSAKPTFVDIDGDGDLDALIGNNDGITQLFINNVTPTLTALASALATGNEDSAIVITFADLVAQGDEADSDGTVVAFVVKAISSGSLKIGVDEQSATDWDVSTNYLVDATQFAYWTADANTNGTQNAFTVTAVDDQGAESATAIQATVEVTAVPDIIITQTAGNTVVTEGGAADTYTLVLESAPTADVIITLGNTNGQASTDFATLTFTTANWNAPQTVTVSAVNDTVGEGMHRSVIQHTVASVDPGYNGLVIGNVIVAVTDNDLRIGNAVFNSPISNPLGLTDVGDYAKPNLVDIDGDGDLDAFIGSYDGNTLFYQNTGTASLAVFAAPISDAFGLTNAGYGAAPSLVDIDGDGDLDAFIGNRDGNALFYKNNGTASLASFAAPISDAFGLTDVGSFASPTFIDIDGDGDLDAFIGNFDGNTLFYQNNGTASLAAFTAPVSNVFGLTDAGISASPTFIDIDGDGDLDAFIGNSDGDILFYQNIGTASLAVFAAPVTNALGLTTVGSSAKPTFVDIDGDGDLDALIGNNDGITQLFINNVAPTLTAFNSTLATGNEDSAIVITFANLAAQGDEADSDGTVVAFVVKAISSGSLKIGVDEQSATDWDVSTNYLVDATQFAYWTADANTNGTQNAFTVTAVDDQGAESATAIQATVDVTAVNDAPTLAGVTAVTNINDTGTATPFSAFTITDADSASLTVSIALDNAAKGVFTAASLSSSGFSTTDALTYNHATGTPAALQAALQLLVFQPTANRVGALGHEITHFTVSVSDGVAPTVTNTTTTVTVWHPQDPTFTTTVTNPFGLTNSDLVARPSLVDIDADGDLDAFIGNNDGFTRFYENTGTFSSASFTVTSYAFGLTDVGNIARPTFVDINGDGDLDAFIGNNGGNTLYYENAGTASSAVFSTPATNAFGLSDVGSFASSSLVDIDGDGDLDAFIGNSAGNTLFYENIGNASGAVFTAPITNAFGLTNVGISATPSLIDIDGDGDLDAFIGNNDGTTLFYRNTGTASRAVFSAPVSNPFGLTDVGSIASPSFVDINGDGKLDALIGNLEGNTLLFINNATPTLSVFDSTLTNGTEDIAITITFANLAAQGDEADSDGTVTAFAVKAITTGTLKIGTSALTATDWDAVTNYLVDATHIAYWTADANTNGTLNAFTVKAVDNTGTESVTAIQATVDVTPVNDAPTLAAFASTLVTGDEDTAIAIAFADLVAQGDEADSDGDVMAFAVKAITSGSLKIGIDEQSATAWDALTNYLVDATQIAYWTPDTNANGTLNAFTVTAVDDLGAESATAIQATVDVTAVNDVPTLTAFASTLATGDEDTAVTITLADLVVQGDLADSDGNGAAFAIKAVSTGTLKIGVDSQTATVWDGSSNYLVDETHSAYWTPDDNVNGILNAFTVTTVDDLGAESATAIQATVDVTAVNDAPTLAAFASTLVTGDEDAAITITLADLVAQGDEADSDGDVMAFAVKTITSGTLKIGVNEQLATAWDAENNYLVDATHLVYWTPEANANGILNAFTLTAVDDLGAESATAIQATVDVTVVNDAPTLAAFASTLVTGDEDTAITITLADLVAQGDEADSDDDVMAFAVKAITSGTLRIGSDEQSATDWDGSSNYLVDETHSAYWTADANANGTQNAFTVTAVDDLGAESATAIQATVSVTAANDAPTLTAFALTLVTGNEDTAITITLTDLVAQGDEADSDGDVMAFAVKAITSGTLKIGVNEQSATIWDAVTNYLVNETQFAYWTPEANANGILNAFTVMAIDNQGLESVTAIQAAINVINLNNNAPVFISGATGTVNENALSSTPLYTAVTTDVDNLLPVTYDLGGADRNWLDINAQTGAVTLKEAADFETKASYNFDVIANDGDNPTTQAVVVSVVNLNDNGPTGLVTITGTAKQNQTLIAANTLADADGLGVIAYQWFANGTVINGATAETFTLGQEQVAQAITVQASYTDDAGALEQVTSAASANVIALQTDTTGNDTFVGSVDNSTVEYDFALAADTSTNFTRVGLSADGKTVVFKGVDGTDTLTNIQDLVFGSDTISMADFLKMVTVDQLFDSLGNANKTYVMPDLYTGPLDLDYQLIDESANAVIIGSDSNDFIKVAGSGNKAVNSGTGNDVIDGSTGSSFLTSGEGNDTVFLDGRMVGTSWSTLTDFQQGQDHATIFGWVNGVSKVVAFSNSDGADGYTGLTLHIQNLLPDGSAAGTTNPALNSITLTGHTLAEFGASSLADLNNQITSGTNTHFLTGQVTDSFGAHGYLYIS
ncbi:FG-GAP-like repeat-containing protein [Methylobacter sp. S3L5C]|uniref:FG-GAP-like repeat-containing protein n=1 Tax=Methylobacter sp. S3L5C TaxID=2839024 RepID=UPI001FAB8A67|nr:FG-GAP-like repeat-containing protein [Methylobacter sp. S3L5C]UOA08407.1 VCBS repeat-containing protein [Methylobacter sp. S3L5C]